MKNAPMRLNSKSKIWALFGVILVASLFVATELRADPRRGFVTARGAKLVDSAGTPVSLKGINLGNWLLPEGYMLKFPKTDSPSRIHAALSELVGPTEARIFWERYFENYITREDIAFIKSLGFNHVRLPFNYRKLVDEDYLGTNNHGFHYIDKVIEWCKEHGLWVLLDMHAAPGGQTGTNIDDSFGYPFLFIDEESQRKTVELWQRIAERYKDEPTVLGYDLLNEPIAHYFENDANKLNEKLEPLYRRIVAAIRAVDKNHLVFLGGAQWNYRFNVFGKPFDTNAVYTFHKYAFDVHFAKDVVIPEFEEYLEFRKRYNVPIYLGESGEDDDEWIRNYRMKLEANEIGWAFWTYKKVDDDKGVVNCPRPANYDSIIAFVDGDRSFYGAVRQARPPFQSSEAVLRELAENVKFKNCRPSYGFIEALGLGAALGAATRIEAREGLTPPVASFGPK